MPWLPAYTPTFRKDYRNLGQQNQQRVNEAIKEILASDDPRQVGRPKLGKWKGACGYDVGRGLRVLYSVEPKGSLVIFLRCGPHKIY